jgi:Tfp pilus assembly protein PilN
MRSINLLPPEAAEKSRARRKVAGLIAVGVLYLGLLGLAAFWQLGKATDAEEAVASQQQLNDALRRQISELGEADDLRRTYLDGLADMETILARDVAWGSLLTDLGRRLPDRTWLGSLQAQVIVVEEDPARFGDLAVEGVAFDYPDTAAFLRSFSGEDWPAVGGAWLPTATEAKIGAVPVVNFSGAAALTVESLSDRLARLPEVAE